MKTRTTFTKWSGLVKNSTRPPDFWFSKRHSPTQEHIAVDFLNATVPLQSFPRTVFEGVSYHLFYIIFELYQRSRLSSTDFIIDIAPSVIFQFHFSYSQLGYKGIY